MICNVCTYFDTVRINFASSTYTILENSGSVSICLTTSGAIDEPLSVAISAIARSASRKQFFINQVVYILQCRREKLDRDLSFSAGVDFTFTPLTVTIPASNQPTGSCFNVGIINDDSVESDEVFLLSLQVPADVDAVAGTTFITSVTILDDDGWLHFAYTTKEFLGPPEIRFLCMQHKDYIWTA